VLSIHWRFPQRQARKYNHQSQATYDYNYPECPQQERRIGKYPFPLMVFDKVEEEEYRYGEWREDQMECGWNSI
jgi:hypothetical protein